MAYWYLARAYELLLDLDEYGRPAKSGGPWGEVFFRRRLRDARASGKLNVEAVYLAHSSTERHFHAIVVLWQDMPEIERLIWQLELGSDLYRGRADLMRAALGQAAPSLLIRNHLMPDFYRSPDYECPCQAKHITSENPDCPIWRRFRGASPWQLFGKPIHSGPEYAVPLPLGKIPIELIDAVKVERRTSPSSAGAGRVQAKARERRRRQYLAEVGRSEK